jgi:hypothetical protein
MAISILGMGPEKKAFLRCAALPGFSDGEGGDGEGGEGEAAVLGGLSATWTWVSAGLAVEWGLGRGGGDVSGPEGCAGPLESRAQPRKMKPPRYTSPFQGARLTSFDTLHPGIAQLDLEPRCPW